MLLSSRLFPLGEGVRKTEKTHLVAGMVRDVRGEKESRRVTTGTMLCAGADGEIKKQETAGLGGSQQKRSVPASEAAFTVQMKCEGSPDKKFTGHQGLPTAWIEVIFTSDSTLVWHIARLMTGYKLEREASRQRVLATHHNNQTRS